MRSKLAILAAAVLAVPAALATPITQVFTITMPYASGAYEAGHVFQITATYDDAGTSMSEWEDGPNGIGELGGGDDVLVSTLQLADNQNYSLFSNVQYSITGRVPYPPGAVPRNGYAFNFAWYYESLDPAVNGFWVLNVVQDDMSFYLQGGKGLGNDEFNLYETYLDAQGSIVQRNVQVAGQGMVDRTTVPVPEPMTIGLMGLGLAGLGIARRRKR